VILVPKPVRVVDEAARAYVRTLPCLLGDRIPCECWSFIRVENRKYASECAHVRVRRHGDDANMVPLCTKHHREHDQGMGPRTFERTYHIALTREAKRIWADYLAQLEAA